MYLETNKRKILALLALLTVILLIAVVVVSYVSTKNKPVGSTVEPVVESVVEPVVEPIKLQQSIEEARKIQIENAKIEYEKQRVIDAIKAAEIANIEAQQSKIEGEQKLTDATNDSNISADFIKRRLDKYKLIENQVEASKAYIIDKYAKMGELTPSQEQLKQRDLRQQDDSLSSYGRIIEREITAAKSLPILSPSTYYIKSNTTDKYCSYNSNNKMIECNDDDKTDNGKFDITFKQDGRYKMKHNNSGKFCAGFVSGLSGTPCIIDSPTDRDDFSIAKIDDNSNYTLIGGTNHRYCSEFGTTKYMRCLDDTTESKGYKIINI